MIERELLAKKIKAMTSRQVRNILIFIAGIEAEQELNKEENQLQKPEKNKSYPL